MERIRRRSSGPRELVLQTNAKQNHALILRAAAAPTRRGTSGPGYQANMFWFFRHMVHPPKNSGWIPGTGFANECKAEPLADNHLSSRGVVGFEPAPHIQRIEEKKHRHRAENAPDPPPKSCKNGGRRHSFGCPEGSGVPQKSI